MSPVEVPPIGESDRSQAARVEPWDEKDRQRQLLDYTIPEFTISYPLGINSNAAKACKDAHDWLLEQNLDKVFPKAELYAKLVQHNVPEFPSMIYIDHGSQALDWACKFFLWLVVLDDQMDETAIGMKRGTLAPVFLELHLVLLWNFPDDPVVRENLTRFLEEFSNSELQEKHREFIDNTVKVAKNFPGTVYDGKLEPIASSLRELWASCVRTMPVEFNLRLARSLQGYFLGNLLEARNREDGIVPSVQVYLAIRRKTVAAEPIIILIHIFEELYMPNDLFYSPPMRRFLDTVIDVIGWHNDVWSFRKEYSRGDIHNLVALISHERKHCTFSESGLVAMEMFNDRITDLDTAADDLLAIAPPVYENVVRRYIKACQHFVSGTQAWHKECNRYK